MTKRRQTYEAEGITVTFDPTATGKFNDQIGLDSTGGNKAIGLSGSAGLPGALQISSEATDYGQVPVGASATKSFTITNVGGTNVTITKSKPPAGGAFMARTSLPEGTTLEPGEGVTETVSFTPTAVGSASGVWQINGDDTTGLHQVQFSGVGVIPGSAPTGAERESPTAQTPAALNALPSVLGVLSGQSLLPSKESLAPPSPDAELVHTALAASHAGVVSVRVSCPVPESRCFGRIALRRLTVIRVIAGHRPKTSKVVVLTLAAGSFSVAGGHVSSVKLHLSAQAQALLARVHVIQGRATIVAHDSLGAIHTALTTVTIRATG